DEYKSTRNAINGLKRHLNALYTKYKKEVNRMSRRTRKEILEDRLTADQLKAVYLLLDNELAPEGSRMSQDEIAAECNVNRSTLYRWRTQNQDFIDYRREVTRNYISDMSGVFLKSLRKSIEGTNGTPSMKALDLFAKVEGLVQT